MAAKLPLTTERLILRGITIADRFFLSDLLGHDEVRRFLGGPIPPNRREEAISACCERSESDESSAMWMVETRVPHCPIGLISITKHKDGEDCELSYEFHPDAWGRGYATEAAKRVLAFDLTNLSCERLIAETQSADAASCRLLERLGMKEIRRVERFGAEQLIYASQMSQNS